MGSVWLSKKAFLYFGGAAIIILGGVIVLIAPYHYVNLSVLENEPRTFSIWDEQGFYPQLEVSVSMRPGNSTTVELDILLVENITLDTYVVNFTLTQDDLIETPDTSFYESFQIIDISSGNYTVRIDHISEPLMVDLGLKQMSDSRIYIGIGGSMNVLGLVMGAAGYFVLGAFLPTDSDTIVEWGYDQEEEEDTFPEG